MVITIPVDELIEEVSNRLEKSDVIPNGMKDDFIASTRTELHNQIADNPDQYVHDTILEMADIIVGKMNNQIGPIMNLMRAMNKEEE